ncbi:Uncharacterized protein TCAP_05063 [Tolypocladium capitatum]|uniref:DUF5672 domain-containing protein n=1 Tax=Tolypocladium capitatum TaxID=45235 RepID=A0A2K3QBQ0_9HYPO|nr:Uncharacterized protein TCAP_05063 [Tolypocladium capitatum]
MGRHMAPWDPAASWAGNGGLSLRRVSRIVNILRGEQREDDSEPEDLWLSWRLGEQPNGHVANGSVSLTFSGESSSGVPEHVSIVPNTDGGGGGNNHDPLSDLGHPGRLVKGIDDWREGYYEPMGYHIGTGGRMYDQIWGTPDRREHIWKYCPEVKMVLEMDMADFVPGTCKDELSWVDA